MDLGDKANNNSGGTAAELEIGIGGRTGGSYAKGILDPIAVEVYIIGSVNEGDKLPLIQRRAGGDPIIGTVKYVIIPVSFTS
jgi:hypothetical protein